MCPFGISFVWNENRKARALTVFQQSGPTPHIEILEVTGRYVFGIAIYQRMKLVSCLAGGPDKCKMRSITLKSEVASVLYCVTYNLNATAQIKMPILAYDAVILHDVNDIHYLIYVSKS